MKVYFNVIRTYVAGIVYVGARPVYFNILRCQYIQAYVCTVHTYATHIIGRRDYTCPYMKPEIRARIQGLHGAVTMQLGHR